MSRANLTAVNPKVLSTPSPQGLPLVQMLAADGHVWKKGEIGYLSSGTVLPITTTTGDTAPYCIFAEDQDAATSTTTVWVRLLVPETVLEIYVCSNGSAAAIGTANKGTAYAIYSTNNGSSTAGICYLDTNVTSGADFVVTEVAAEYEPTRNVSSDTPGKCKVVYRP